MRSVSLCYSTVDALQGQRQFLIFHEEQNYSSVLESQELPLFLRRSFVSPSCGSEAKFVPNRLSTIADVEDSSALDVVAAGGKDDEEFFFEATVFRFQAAEFIKALERLGTYRTGQAVVESRGSFIREAEAMMGT